MNLEEALRIAISMKYHYVSVDGDLSIWMGDEEPEETDKCFAYSKRHAPITAEKYTGNKDWQDTLTSVPDMFIPDNIKEIKPQFRQVSYCNEVSRRQDHTGCKGVQCLGCILSTENTEQFVEWENSK